MLVSSYMTLCSTDVNTVDLSEPLIRADMMSLFVLNRFYRKYVNSSCVILCKPVFNIIHIKSKEKTYQKQKATTRLQITLGTLQSHLPKLYK